MSKINVNVNSLDIIGCDFILNTHIEDDSGSCILVAMPASEPLGALMSDLEIDPRLDPIRKREIYAQHDRSVDDPMSFLFDVDPTWAEKYIDLSRTFHQFPLLNDILHVSPRVVKIVLTRPQSLIRLLDAKHDGKGDLIGEHDKALSWAEYRAKAIAGWDRHLKIEWYVAELLEAATCFHEGMTPLEAMMDIHSDCLDGEEDRPFGLPFGNSLLPMLFTMTLILAVAVVMKVYMSSAVAHSERFLAP